MSTRREWRAIAMKIEKQSTANLRCFTFFLYYHFAMILCATFNVLSDEMGGFVWFEKLWNFSHRDQFHFHFQSKFVRVDGKCSNLISSFMFQAVCSDRIFSRRTTHSLRSYRVSQCTNIANSESHTPITTMKKKLSFTRELFAAERKLA